MWGIFCLAWVASGLLGLFLAVGWRKTWGIVLILASLFRPSSQKQQRSSLPLQYSLAGISLLTSTLLGPFLLIGSILLLKDKGLIFTRRPST